MACAVEFFSHFTAFASGIEADCSEIKQAMQLPMGGSGSGVSYSSIIEDSLDSVNQTRDKSHVLLKSMASPSLQELVEAFSAMYDANQLDLEALDMALSENPAYTPLSNAAYVPATTASAANSDPSNALLGSPSGATAAAASPSAPRYSESGASAPVASTSATSYLSPAHIPSHLLVEPKTPDLEDFGISSVSLQFLQSDAPPQAAQTAAPAPAPSTATAAAASTSQPSAAAAAAQSKIPKPQVSASASTVSVSPDGAEGDGLGMSPSFASRYDISTPEAAAPPPAKAAATEAPPQPSFVAPPAELAANVGGRNRGGGGGMADLAGGDTMFPLMPLVTDEQFNGVPEYLRSQISCELLNSAVTKINDYVTDKRFDPDCGSDVLTTEELQSKLKLGIKTKAYVLLLMNLGRIKTTKHKGQIVYKIVS